MSNQPHTWPRLFVSEPLSSGLELALGPDPSRYLCQVLRLQQGEPVRLFNGRDGEWRATLAAQPKGKKTGAVLHVEEQRIEQHAEPDVWLCAAPIKRAHFDFLVMKATELGVSAIQPVLTARTQIRDVNPERLRAIAIEAAEQSERLTIPEIREALPLESLLAHWPEKRPALLCAEMGEALPLAQALAAPLFQERKKVAVFTGPEGGYEAAELARLRLLPESAAVRLGPRILRADTAAIAALSCWQAQCGDWQQREGQDRRKQERL